MTKRSAGLYGSRTDANIARVAVAELLGTYFLVLAGTVAAVTATLALPVAGSPADTLSVALAFGLALIALVFALGHVSGAHFNPAVTLALAAVGRFPWTYVPYYVAAQLVGACLAAASVRFAYGAEATSAAALGATLPAAGVGAGKVALVEAVATFLLMLVIMAIATDSRSQKAAAGTAIGFTLTVGILIAGPLTGGALNPARALGPMIVSGHFDALWAYVVGPVVGALLAAFTYANLLAEAEEPDKSEDAD